MERATALLCGRADVPGRPRSCWIASAVASLRRVADALDDGAISAHPLSGLRWSPKATTKRRSREPARALTRAELALLLEHVCPDRRLMVAFMAATGCRVSETLGLDWPDLDLGDRPQMRVGAQR